MNKTIRSYSKKISFIEFVGLSGAGKSTIAKDFEVLLNDHGVKVETRVQLIGVGSPWPIRTAKRLRFILRNWRQFGMQVNALKLIVNVGQNRLLDGVKAVWALWTMIALVSTPRRKDNHILILDQGLIQAVLSAFIGGRGSPDERWCALLNELDLSNFIVVVVETLPQTARSRLRSRVIRDSRMQSGSSINDEELWNETARKLDELVRLMEYGLSAEKRPRLIYLNTEQTSPRENAQKLASEIFGVMPYSEPEK